ncbi:MAG: FAD-dependent oxidoreductase, partial [Moorella sp. (in: Bacteria)]|nr:FAD-dependent oxidoreductase [Moorella sp. (in: firmicutes)]
IGGGLAGTSCAWVLRQQGLHPVIFEKEACLAAGASGNEIGLYNPRFTAQHCPESAFYTAAFAQAVRTLGTLSTRHAIGFDPSGALHLANSPEKAKRFAALKESWGWHEDHLRLLTAAQAMEEAGVPLKHDALFLPDSGSVSPAALCAAYAEGVEVRLATPVDALAPGMVNGEHFDAVILASAFATKEFGGLSWLPLHTVRGQTSTVTASSASAALRRNL